MGNCSVRKTVPRIASVVGLRTAAEGQDPKERFAEVSDLLGATRPTAVNLRWALDRGRVVFEEHAGRGTDAAIAALLDWAHGLHAADVSSCRRIGDFGAELFTAGDRVLTHCNTGALATAGYGTALGVITSSFRDGKLSQVWVDETRPLLQGASHEPQGSDLLVEVSQFVREHCNDIVPRVA